MRSESLISEEGIAKENDFEDRKIGIPSSDFVLGLK